MPLLPKLQSEKSKTIPRVTIYIPHEVPQNSLQLNIQKNISIFLVIFVSKTNNKILFFSQLLHKNLRLKERATTGTWRVTNNFLQSMRIKNTKIITFQHLNWNKSFPQQRGILQFFIKLYKLFSAFLKSFFLYIAWKGV